MKDTKDHQVDDLATLKAKLAEMKQAAEERATQRAADQELAQTRQALTDAMAIAEMEEKYPGQTAVVETDLGAIVVRRPNAVTFKKFNDKEGAKYDDVLAFVLPCCVYPGPAQVQDILKDLPATLARLARTASELAGHRFSEQFAK